MIAVVARCPSCGAPLEDGSIQCRYCKSRQDLDLSAVHRYTSVMPESRRRCPHCNIYMNTVDLSSSLGPFFIEHCPVCYGLFFDPGELEKVLERGVSNAFVIDYAMLDKLAAEQRDRRETVRYISCPVCGKLMNRVNYGSRSGVVVDSCREHGLWLDAGELKRLLEWTKAGGQLFHQQLSQAQKKIEEQKARRQKGQVTPEALGPYEFHTHQPGLVDILGDLARYLIKAVK